MTPFEQVYQCRKRLDVVRCKFVWLLCLECIFVSLLVVLVFERKVGLIPVNKSVDTCCPTSIWKSRHFFLFAPAVTACVLSYNMISVSRSCAPRGCSSDRLACGFWQVPLRFVRSLCISVGRCSSQRSRVIDGIRSPIGVVRLLRVMCALEAIMSVIRRETSRQKSQLVLSNPSGNTVALTDDTDFLCSIGDKGRSQGLMFLRHWVERHFLIVEVGPQSEFNSLLRSEKTSDYQCSVDANSCSQSYGVLRRCRKRIAPRLSRSDLGSEYPLPIRHSAVVMRSVERCSDVCAQISVVIFVWVLSVISPVGLRVQGTDRSASWYQVIYESPFVLRQLCVETKSSVCHPRNNTPQLHLNFEDVSRRSRPAKWKLHMTWQIMLILPIGSRKA